MGNILPSIHTDVWVFNDSENEHFRKIRSFASEQLDVPYEDVTVERYEYHGDELYEATVSIPFGDGYASAYVNNI